MIKLKRRKDEKWIFQKNVSSKDIIQSYVEVVKDLEKTDDKQSIQNRLKELDAYKGRSIQGSLSTMGVRFSQMCFYMFGYKDSGNIFVPTQMTSNILSDEKHINKNMLVNLFSLQFPHPYSKTPDCFRIYAGRLILKLLTEIRINKKLYIDEFIWFLPFVRKIDKKDYDELVESIIDYRKLSYEEKTELFKSVDNYIDLFANCMHECKYYFMRIFEGFNVFELVEDIEHNDGKLFSFKHGNTKTFRKDNIGKKYSGYVKLNSELLEDAEKLLDKYSPFESPETLSDVDVFSKKEWITNLYDVEPLKYLSLIIPELKAKEEIVYILNDMVYKSKYGSVDGKEFEESLKPVFDLFDKVLNSEVISGAGNTDVLCVIEGIDSTTYKMNVDGKSRGSSTNLNVKRLDRHMKKHNSKYCIVVAPKFSHGTILDIEGERIVALKSDILAKYCSKECLSNSSYLADYASIEKIIENNLGTDISNLVDNLTNKRYGVQL